MKNSISAKAGKMFKTFGGALKMMIAASLCAAGIGAAQPKTGTFKGSFKVYFNQDGKLKKSTVKVNGVVVGGVGYGEAVCKKPAVNWKLSVK